jgi:hypothetical protein
MERKTIDFEITEHIGVIAEHPTGWTKELNIVKWGDREPKYDIRDWDEEHERMSRGLTLTEEEARKLHKLLAEL